MNLARALRRMGSGIGLLFYPVSRKLVVCTLAYMTGIVFAQKWSFSPMIAGTICAFLLALAARCRCFHRSLLPIVCAGMLVVGNCMAGQAMASLDAPTAPRTAMSGTVLRVEKEARVLLKDVVLSDGTAIHRPVRVSLMTDEETDLPESPKPGQRVSGIGRLFAQDGVRNSGGVDQRLRALCDDTIFPAISCPTGRYRGKRRFLLQKRFVGCACFYRISSNRYSARMQRSFRQSSSAKRAI